MNREKIYFNMYKCFKNVYKLYEKTFRTAFTQNLKPFEYFDAYMLYEDKNKSGMVAITFHNKIL